jgi:hypothetical protein
LKQWGQVSRSFVVADGAAQGLDVVRVDDVGYTRVKAGVAGAKDRELLELEAALGRGGSECAEEKNEALGGAIRLLQQGRRGVLCLASSRTPRP